ncbi:MAG: Holliday junction resolvase RuvX [bacterium]|nr:Holliday junction resolvase RuvX [bacterium]
MRVLGIDVGTKRVGLALGDTDSRVASPLATIEAEDAQKQIVQLIGIEEIKLVVVGMPHPLQGDRGVPGEAERMVASFIDQLKGRIKIPVVTEDERFSTDAARALIGPRGKDRDAVAASVILQGYFDRHFSSH